MPPRRWLRACLAASGAPFLGSRFLSQKLQRLCASPSICRRLLAATNAFRQPHTVPSQSREKQNGPIMLDGELVHSCSLLYILNQRPTADPPPTSRSLHAHATHRVLVLIALWIPSRHCPCTFLLDWCPMAGLQWQPLAPCHPLTPRPTSTNLCCAYLHGKPSRSPNATSYRRLALSRSRIFT